MSGRQSAGAVVDGSGTGTPLDDGDALTMAADGDARSGLSLEWLPLGVLIIDQADRILFANARAGEWLGRIVRGPLAATFGNEGAQRLCRLVARARRDGDLVVRDVRIRAVDGSDGLHDLWLSLMPARHRHEGDDAGGRVLVLLDRSQARDFTGRAAELDAARRLGEGLGMALAHEIRNPLAGIRGAAQLLEARCGPRDRRLTRLIRDEVDRIDRLVARVAEVSQPGQAARCPLNIHEVLDHVATLCQAEQAAGVEAPSLERATTRRVGEAVRLPEIAFERLYDPSLPPVPGDRDALTQVFLNLVRNACEALGEQGGGTVRLITAYRHGLRRHLEDGRVQHLPIEIRIADDGPGVAEPLRPHLFEAFVSGRGTGRGLGLALVGRIVREHGGLVRYEAGRDGGAVFVINMPAAGQAGEGNDPKGEHLS